MNAPFKFELSQVRMSFGYVMQHEAVYATMNGFPAPIGFIWYRHPLKRNVEILYVFTHERARRRGIAFKMLNQLREWYPNDTIGTAIGNELSTPWLIKTGFICEPTGWLLRPDEPCPAI